MPQECLMGIGVVVDRNEVWCKLQPTANQRPGCKCMMVIIDNKDALPSNMLVLEKS